MTKRNFLRKRKISTVADSGFDLIDYWNMFKHDFRTPFIYFFDLVNQTDTHKRLLVEDYDGDIQDSIHAFNHSCSWTSIIKASLTFVSQYLGSKSSEYSFFDVGCGKGKVLLVASREGFSENFLGLYGIEINDDLVEVAHNNFQAMGLPPCNIITESARTFDLGKINKKVVIYLYNPFDETLLGEFLKVQSVDECIIIYNNPQFAESIASAGYKVIKNKEHTMINGQVTIYEKL